MSIGLISSPLASTAASAASAASASTSAAAATQSAPDSGSATGASSAAFRQVVSQYNIQKISPQQFSTMIQQLSKAGAISSSDQQQLTQMRAVMDASGAQPDEPLDLVQFFQSKAQSASSTASDGGSAGTTASSAAQLQLQWAQKLATIQSSSSQSGVDTTV